MQKSLYISEIGNISIYQVRYQSLNGAAQETARIKLWNTAGNMGQEWKELYLNLAVSCEKINFFLG